MVRGAVRVVASVASRLDGRLALVAATRYMVAQRLRRNVLFSTQNALKLQRGEALNEEG